MFKNLYEEITELNKTKSDEKDNKQEKLNQEKRLKLQGIKVLLMTGRFQPFSLAHKLIAENGLKQSGASKLIIGLVKGKKSSKDKEKNPLNTNYQKSLIKKCLPKSEIIILENSFIPNVVLKLREKGYEVIGIVSGDDRKKEYNTQFKYFDNIKLKESSFVVPKIKSYTVNRNSELTKNISATNIRKAIKDNNQKEFNKMMPEELHSEWETLSKLIYE